MKPIFLIIILAFVSAFNQASAAQSKSKTKNIPRAPSQVNIEEMFGQPIDCNPNSATCFDQSGNKITCPFTIGFTCFKNEQRVIIRVQFNDKKYAKKIIIFDGMNAWAAVEAGNQIVMLNGRGKLLKKGNRASGSCDSDFTDEYEYLTMRYESKNCQGSHPGGVTITWKE